MKKTYITSLIFFLLFLWLGNKVFWDEDTNIWIQSSLSQKTIIEINSNIKELEREKIDLDDKWEKFQQEHGAISDFIKTNLSEREKFEIEEINYIYNSRKKSLELKLVEKVKTLKDSEDIKIQLIELKKEFYKDIIKYVDISKTQDFLTYIKWDIEFNEKNKEVKEELYKEKVILQEKVDTLKEKMEAHQQLITERIENIVREKVWEKIKEIQSKEKYILLSQSEKILLFEKTLEKTIWKRWELENIENKSSIIQKKIELYKIIEMELQVEINKLLEK